MLAEVSHQFVEAKSDQPPAANSISFLELEITGFCQLKCRHCYADSGPENDHGSMTADDWERVIDEAHTLSVDTVRFIDGEPTLHPELPRLVRYALGKGLKLAPRGIQLILSGMQTSPQAWAVMPGLGRTSSRRSGAASRSGPGSSRSWTGKTRPRLARSCSRWA